MYLEKNIGQKCEHNTTNMTKELIIYVMTEVASALPVLEFLVLFASKPISCHLELSIYLLPVFNLQTS